MQGLIGLIVWLLLGALAFWTAVWVVGVLELRNPIRQIVLAIVGIIALLVILNRLGIVT